MGSSDTETSSGVVDSTVGAIVWVRRRNGSWWPGKILGADELSASHLMSPRSGTPVKLLGREDASVDWYNLEKSKRVKAFRCGEFDDCIDKAEASQGMPPKKREKYARREDAIIHALELEKHFLEKQYGKLGSSNYKSNIKKELATSAESMRHDNGKLTEPKSEQPTGGLDLPHGGIISPHLQIQEVREAKQLSGDDDKADVLPRMRGLEDIGLRTTTKSMIIPPIDSTGQLKSPLGDGSHAPFNGDATENTSHVNDKISLEKRKRSNEGFDEESLVKRRDKRRPLVQVLESSAKLPAPSSLKPEGGIVSTYIQVEEQTGGEGSAKRSKCVYQTKSSNSTDNTETHSEHLEVSASKLEVNSNPPPALGKDSTSGSTEDTETDSSETDSVESDSDEEMDEISDESVEFMPKFMLKSELQEEDDSTSTEEPDDPTTPSDMSHPSNDDVSASAGVSKWQLKGKRNTRALTKRYVDLSDGKVLRGSNQGPKIKEKGSYADLMDSFDKKYGTRIGGYGSRGVDGISRGITSWEDLAWNDQPASKGYWGDFIEYTDPVFSGRRFGDRRKCMLIEVDLKVQSNYQREHVPMISLMSKLNGQAIVGHPIQIEALEYGSTEGLMTAADELNQDNDTSLPPVWRTARRTANCRVPRPRASTVDADEGAEHLQHVYQDRKNSLNKSNGGNFSNRQSLARKSSTHGSRPTDKRLLRKPAKKTSVASNQKTRTLSSIATQQKPNNILKPGSNSSLNGFIKPEIAPPAVACIPIKLVFSRLHEELAGRHQ
ncbi:hypothetical protein DCAR_0416344 [Daucus carota subsp. sativus]|uniref:PWWP domain-containing protein n=1 Tax=Daucus carota subsp. sativus TaxID=79200 RepID=A0A165XDV0_DAUCS|nr:PREDICTED: uncharacterized protein At1g51745-like [Daucus carota subsp. sativus]WOG97005.1 hypothetical protein DCAR_0416344 [Daucus carota subsp. sativus]